MMSIKGKFTEAEIFTDNIEQSALSQLYGLCNHPVFENASIKIMPDVHSGEGCTIGTTIKMNKREVIPSIVGVDISCGVYTTIFSTDKLKTEEDFKKLDDFICNFIPNGMTIRETIHNNMDKSLMEDIVRINNKYKFGDTDDFLKSCGTLGGGNHYIEVGIIDAKNNIFALSVHSGSRKFGKRAYEYFERIALDKYDRPDILVNQYRQEKEALIAKLKQEGKSSMIQKELEKLEKAFKFQMSHEYPKDMATIEGIDFDNYMECLAVLEKFANESRKLMSQDILNFLEANIQKQFDTTHNYIEVLEDDSIVIRKGAISAKEGELVAIPLNMKDGVILGVGKGNPDWNYSAPHGAGRQLSRSKAKEQVLLEDFENSMNGINTWSVCSETLDESPQAYKPSKEIVDLVKDTVDIEYIVKPIYNFKAHSAEKSFKEIKMEEKKAKKAKREAGL